MTLTVNFYGGPGAGKSTLTAGVFYYLKLMGANCVMAREYAKDLVWEGRVKLLTEARQSYIFSKQLKRLQDVAGQVDVVLTDSPLLLSAIYSRNPVMRMLVKEHHDTFVNMNYVVRREKDYQPIGRLQSEEEAQELDVKIETLLSDLGETFETVSVFNAPTIAARIMSVLEEGVWNGIPVRTKEGHD